MKTIFKYLLYFIFFIITLFLFLPKENIYYAILETLQKNKIVLSHSTLSDDYFSLDIKNIKTKYDDIEVSNNANFHLDMFLYKTNINIYDINIDQSFSKYIPTKIKNININHTIIDPLYINIDFDFGKYKAIGQVNLLKRVVKIDFNVDKLFKVKYKYIAKQLKQIKNNSDKKQEVYSFEYKY
ncbi:MAG: hypothetical protein U9O56_08745 [Campylobacterota bacterium]|nr:hypothetical protein [Campylobacterota bacterium]